MQPRRQRADLTGPESGGRRFLLYVEGPRDRDILRSWARRGWREVARAIEQDSVILGGRQPARAIEHFLAQRDTGADRALCILDRDEGERSTVAEGDGPSRGIEFFVWPRRHIESYLLDWSVIERCLAGRLSDPRLARAARELLPEEDEESLRRFDAKRLLSPRGPLAQLLEFDLRAGQIARAMKKQDLHRDIAGLFERIRRGLGLPSEGPEVVVRAGGGR